MIRILIVLSVSIACLAGADEADAISKAYQQLSQITELDTPTFDECADILLEHRKEAFLHYEQHHRELKQSAGPIGKFQLERIHDMLVWPIDRKGMVVSNMHNPRVANMGDLKTFMIFYDVNGHRIDSAFQFYEDILERPEVKRAGIKTYAGLYRGHDVIAKTRSQDPGFRMMSYPNEIAHYVHEGKRKPTYDDLVKEGLRQLHLEQSAEAGEALISALKQGCNDPMVYFYTLHALIEDSTPEQVIAIYDQYHETIDFTYNESRPFEALAKAVRGKALLKGERLEEGLALLESVEQELVAAEEEPMLNTILRVRGLIAANNGNYASAEELLNTALKKYSNGGWRKSMTTRDLIRFYKMKGDERKAMRLYTPFHDKSSRRSIHCNDSLIINFRYRYGTWQIVRRSNLYSSSEAYEKNGAGDGLLCEYFKDTELKEKASTSIERGIDHNWRNNAPVSGGFPNDHFSVRWTGLLCPDATGKHKLLVKASDGIRLWIDDKLIVEHWEETKKEESYKASINLTKGKPVSIKAEYYNGTGKAFASLQWILPESYEKTDVHWSLAGRYNYNYAPALPYLLYYNMKEHQDLAPKPGKDGRLRFDLAHTGTYWTGWNYYDSHFKMESEVSVGYVNYKNILYQSRLGMTAFFTKRTKYETGLLMLFPDNVRTIYSFDGGALRYYVPELNFRATNKLSLIRKGTRVEHRINDTLIDVQNVPIWYHGRWLFRFNRVEWFLNHLNLYVASREPVDNDHLIALYDKAAQAMHDDDLEQALGLLEEAAALQVVCGETARVYAAYLLSKHDRTGALAVLHQRMQTVTDIRQVGLLADAEFHVFGQSENDTDILDDFVGINNASNEGRWITDRIPGYKKHFNHAASTAVIICGFKAHQFDCEMKKGGFEDLLEELHGKSVTFEKSALLPWTLYQEATVICNEPLLEKAMQLLKQRFPRVKDW